MQNKEFITKLKTDPDFYEKAEEIKRYLINAICIFRVHALVKKK